MMKQGARVKVYTCHACIENDTFFDFLSRNQVKDGGVGGAIFETMTRLNSSPLLYVFAL